MRRTERLFQIIQILRSRRRPVTGKELAEELEISLRTLYRDMAELTAGRVPVRGEAGTGYVLEDGYDMPPLMLTPDELEAAVLGAAWVAKNGDPALAVGARDLIGKLTSAIPPELRPVLIEPAVHPIVLKSAPPEIFDLATLREAVRAHRKISIDYTNRDGETSSRVIWPFLIGYMEHVRLIAAWCELKQDFRNFCTESITKFEALDETYPDRTADLMARWAKVQNIVLT